MTPIGAAAASVPAAPTDPRELALHLEICRLQAELEGLEARIHQVEAARAAGGSGYDPFVERAEELVERMVASLYVTGRAEIAEAAAAADAEAEAVIAEARARAQAILTEARGELAAVLVDRADAVDAAVVPGPVLDLTEPAPPNAAEPVPSVVAEPLMVVVADEVDGAPAAGTTAEVGTADVDTPEADAPVPTDTVEVPELPEPVTATATVVEPVVDAEPTAPAAPAAVVLPDEHVVPEGHVSSLEAITPHLPPMAPAGGAAASARTDAAFEAWLAVGPTPSTEPAAHGGAEPDDEIVPAGVRPAWVRPVEAAIALLAVAVLVVLALLLVG